ncbi:unnamed protein product [Taenia asiatica]|uniref:Protein xylosyltransferase n=1 Tax=Taenia asiatica TaxID=60517 RepID=A0A0R3VWL7_TAEAS|nr:unnamed protein product [Taenia asiatica]
MIVENILKQISSALRWTEQRLMAYVPRVFELEGVVTILRLAIILPVAAFTFCIIWKIIGKEGINGALQADLEYFAAIASPLHPGCKTVRQEFPIVDERDDDMDIAFTLVVHKDAVQVARLIRMIHRTNDYYCIHPDLRSFQQFVDAFKGILTCFGPNVKWGDGSVLKPQLICGKQSLQRHTSWKCLINSVGRNFPLRTNLELTAALKAVNGSNLIESFSIDEYKRWVGNAALPLGVSDPRGCICGAYPREFLAEANLGSKVEAIRKVMLQHKAFGHPDELFFPTLAYNSHFQLLGSCLIAPTPSSKARFNFLGKYVIWVGHNITCSTKYVRGVCILGEEHVDQLRRAPHISANKFHAGFHPEAYSKMGRWYFDKVQIERSTSSYSKHHFDPAVCAALS